MACASRLVHWSYGKDTTDRSQSSGGQRFRAWAGAKSNENQWKKPEQNEKNICPRPNKRQHSDEHSDIPIGRRT